MTRNLTRTGLTGASLAIALLLSAGSVQAQSSEDKWEWIIAPYLWASDVDLDLEVNDQTIGGSASFSDLLDKVDTAFMGHVEARKGKWGIFGDVIYLDLSENKTISVGPGGPILGDLEADARLKMQIYEFGGAFDVSGSSESTRVDLLAGIRYIDADITANLTLPGPMATQLPISTGPSETDLMVGFRVVNRFAERWSIGARGDVSYGGTDGVLNGFATVGYTFGDTGLFTLTAGYRYMAINIAGSTPNGSPTEADIVMSGPVLGGVFKF
jgi:hypothetical protein